MMNVEQTIISQYGNSPTILALIRGMNAYIDPSADIDAFYNLVFNLDTAQGFGLDIWGRIVGVDRTILTNPVYSLLDDAYRQLIYLKALSNISASTAPSINQLLQNFFASRGRCYVNDLGNMEIRYTFEFRLLAYEIFVVQNSGIFLRPAGVSATLLQTSLPVFGFSEAGSYTAAPFGQAPFLAGDSTYAVE